MGMSGSEKLRERDFHCKASSEVCSLRGGEDREVEGELCFKGNGKRQTVNKLEREINNNLILRQYIS